MRYQRGRTGLSMPKLPSFRRIRVEDYAEADRSLVERLSVSLNAGIEALYDALNNKLTFADNIASTVSSVQVMTTAAGIPTTTTSFTITAGVKATGVMVIDVRGVDEPAYPTSGVTVSWTQNNNNIIINHITGLQVNKLYSIRLIAVF